MQNILFLFFLSFGAMAQTDSVKVQFSEEKGTLQKTEMVDNSTYVLRLQEPANQLFKFQIGQTPNSRSSDGNLEFNLTAAYERKLGKHFSINAGLDYWSIDEGFNNKFLSVLVEPRWYLKQDVSNLSGMYLGVRYLEKIGGVYYNSQLNNNATTVNRAIGLSVGVQNRFLRTGLFDINFMAGVENSTTTKAIWDERNYVFTGKYEEQTNNNWFIRSEARIGLGVSNNSQKYKANSCDIFRCFESQKQWLKVDFTKMFYLSETRQDVNIGLDYEFKLGQSAWSINQGLKLKYRGYESGRGNFSANYDISPRYYYNLNKRIAYGKSANNLSANYIAPIAGFDIAKTYKRDNQNNFVYDGYGLTRKHIGLMYGVQRRLIKNGFIDVNAGVAKVLDDTFVDGPFSRSSGLFLLFNFKVGYAIF
jgi:hypothetical protein